MTAEQRAFVRRRLKPLCSVEDAYLQGMRDAVVELVKFCTLDPDEDNGREQA